MALSLGFLAMMILVFVFFLVAGAQQPQPFYLKQDQTVDLASETKLIKAKQSCENWALAAGLETMLRHQNVALDQNFWLMKLEGGDLCLTSLPKVESLAQTVNGEFVLDDGRRVRLETHFITGAPVNIDSVIVALKLQQVSLVIWRGHPYFLSGITYDEHILSNGMRVFVLKEMRLANTFPKLPGVTFEKGRDNPDDIQGILDVTVAAQ
ncbi:MAG TPA: hypothetical protein VKU42_14745 [Candidatus Angelobacter sp.]|nr:hypothetical protein [Candidatus Angelobacter sp.]